MSSSSSTPIRGYFQVKAVVSTVPHEEKIDYLWGTRESTELWVRRHYPSVIQRGTVKVTPIYIGVLDSVGVTSAEAGNALHGVIMSALLSAVPKPPLGTRQYRPPSETNCPVCNGTRSGGVCYDCMSS
jgi:hypothetical protein